MKSAGFIFLLLAGGAGSAFSQGIRDTDAWRKDLAGPVKTVSATANRTEVTWQQPGGPTLLFPIACWECEFDPKGNQTKSGQIFEGRFQGEIIRLGFDALGNVMERFAEDTSTFELVRHEVIGPFGATQGTS